MTTQTAERRELQRVIDTLPDDGVVAMLDFARGLRTHMETVDTEDGFLPHIPNAETAAAIREGRAGNVKSFNSVDALLADLRNDNDD